MCLVQALQLPLEEIRASVSRELSATLQGVKAAAAAADGQTAAEGDGAAASIAPAPSLSTAVAGLDVADGVGEAIPGMPFPLERLAYVSVGGLDEEALRAAARVVLPQELHGRLRKGVLHVTLWHRWARDRVRSGEEVRAGGRCSRVSKVHRRFESPAFDRSWPGVAAYSSAC